MDPSDSLTVTELLARARAGDSQGRETLFAASRGFLELAAQAQIDDRLQSKVDSSDLVQLTLLEAHRDFQRFSGETTGEWLTWLKRILKHNATDAARHYRGAAKRAAGREVSLSPAKDDSLPGIDPVGRDQTPSQELQIRDDQLRVAAALAQLSEDHRQVIMLRNLQRLPFDEVAQQMGRSRPAAQMIWMRAMKKLQSILEATEPRA